MKSVPFAEYEEMAASRLHEPPPRWYSMFRGVLMKRHEGFVWKPIDWCDECEADLTGGLFYDPETGKALCSECAGHDDGAEARALGIKW